MYTEYGPVFAMSIMGNTEIIISNPEVYNSVCRKEGKFPVVPRLLKTFVIIMKKRIIPWGCIVCHMVRNGGYGEMH